METHFSKIFKGLVLTFIFIVTIHVLFYLFLLIYKIENPLYLKFMSMFDFNEEQNVPTYFITLILLISACLLWLIANNEKIRRDRILWKGLSWIFLYMSLDEFTTLHEGLMFHLTPGVEFTGFLQFSWVIPFGILALIVAALYAPFTLRLPKTTRNRFILAGFIYVSGAIGLEMVGAKLYSLNITNGFFMLTYTLEEIAENVGILIFVFALAEYMKLKSNSISIKLSDRITDKQYITHEKKSNGTVEKNKIAQLIQFFS